jgi:hypothetical protein
MTHMQKNANVESFDPTRHWEGDKTMFQLIPVFDPAAGVKPKDSEMLEVLQNYFGVSRTQHDVATALLKLEQPTHKFEDGAMGVRILCMFRVQNPEQQEQHRVWGLYNPGPVSLVVHGIDRSSFYCSYRNKT